MNEKEIISTVRSRKINTSIILQSVTQLKKSYGDAGETIIDRTGLVRQEQENSKKKESDKKSKVIKDPALDAMTKGANNFSW